MDGLISLLCPSRGRPERCQAMWQSALETADDPLRVELVLYLDDDDPALAAYRAWIRASDHSRVKDLDGPRIVLSETWNRCWAVAAGEIGWHGNDDVLFRSHGWDTAVRQSFEAIPDRIAVLYGRDGIHDAHLSTLSFLHRRWIDTVGYIVPPYFSSDMNDLWIFEVGRMLGRTAFMPNVLTEHLHPVAHKREWDDTDRERMRRGADDHVEQRYRDLLPERQAWAEKLRAVME